MSDVLCVTWKTKPGEEAAVADLLRQVSRATNEEPGCELFRVHRSLHDRAAFFLYEWFTSAAASETHSTSTTSAAPSSRMRFHRLADRRRERFEIVA